MKSLFRSVKSGFEKLTSVAIAIPGNSLTFILAVCTVIFGLSRKVYYSQDIRACIGYVRVSK